MKGMRKALSIGAMLVGLAGLATSAFPWAIETREPERKLTKLKNPYFLVYWITHELVYDPHGSPSYKERKRVEKKSSLTLVDVSKTWRNKDGSLGGQRADTLEVYLSELDSIEFVHWKDDVSTTFYGYGNNLEINGYYELSKATKLYAFTRSYDPRRDGAGSPNIKEFVLTEVVKMARD